MSLFNISIAIEAVLANKVRAVLTALGIIFGVAAVISMLAVGNGAKKEILEQIKLVGANNLVVTPIFELDELKQEGDEEIQKFSNGLTLLDAQGIKEVIPTVSLVSPEVVIKKVALRDGKRMKVRLVGITNDFFGINNFSLSRGSYFNRQQLIHGNPVCIIGSRIRTRFFNTEDPIGKHIKVGHNWLQVVGVLEGRVITDAAMENLGIRDYNMDIYVPIKTSLLRYRNRALITSGMLEAQNNWILVGSASEEQTDALEEKRNYHQLDRLVVQVDQTEKLRATAQIISRMLKRRHSDLNDFTITIPELLLKQQQRTKDIFNIVLGAIAGISLIVGGIGIMNIMLASVLERIKEIGLRLSLGATKKDVVQQFMIEAIFISVVGGILGIFLGIFMALAISHFTEITTVITFSSIIISFVVSATVGLVFGIMPAQRAAQQDPIKSLRYE